MLAYFLLLAALIILAPLSMYKRRVYLLVALSMIWIVMGYRGFTVGNDTSTYVQLYPQLAQQDLTNGFFEQMIGGRFEFGFVFLVKCLYFISSDPRLLLIVVATFEVVSLGYFLGNLSVNIPLSMILFVTMNFMGLSMSAMRQCIAMSFGMISIIYLLKAHKWRFLMVVLLAATFHKAALVLLILYPIYQMDISAKALMLWTGLFMIVYLTFGSWFNVLTQQVTAYTNYGLLNNGADSNSLGIAIKILELSVIIVFCILSKRPKETPVVGSPDFDLKTWKFLLFMLAIGIAFSILALKFSQISRISIFFEVAMLVLVPRSVGLMRLPSSRLIGNIVTICIAVSYFYIIQAYRPEWYGIVPYVFTG
ncbi:EpsG family protein [Latilactobacillus curvatus]|uniref:EpsG family protein n=1 Tax=Latilactobacillus curvatus TaxID=28038 RepID=UPI00223BCFC6|nr:EpsG family protein [Latilactobacillus curvatus]MCS8617876.1 EpsG family protein [Latilactobacillus curvatus]